MRGSERRHSARTMSCDLWGSESHVTCSSFGEGSSGSSSSPSLSSSSSSSSMGLSLLRLLLPNVPKLLFSDEEELDEPDEEVVDRLSEARVGYPGSNL